jgi:glutamyl-tRNA synthetase
MSASRGVRFAPSPTGAFHLGNFRTAWISHELARARGEPWVLRFEDIDAPRVAAGAMERQLAELERLGPRADEVRVQSRGLARHREAFFRAVRASRVYPCFCSRKDVREALEGIASAPHGEGPVYSGRCRGLEAVPEHALPTLAWRFRAADPAGRDDFIVARSAPALDREGLPPPESFVPAYHWACAIDDLDGRYRWLVRAWDLASAEEPQRWIRDWLAREEGREPAHPRVIHCALVTQDDGARLEKRTRGITLPELEASGWTPERLARAFRDSLDPVVLAGEESEARRRITLSELLTSR